VANQEQRSMVGFVCGWFLLLIQLFSVGALLASAWHLASLLELALHCAILACAALTCALELEINSPLIRDHLALPVERALAFLQLASGRGVFYCATGLLAIDTRRRAQIFAGGALLVFGAANLLLGSVVAVKLKRMRRSLATPAALLTAYRARAASEGALNGLNHAASGRLFSELGVKFGKIELQAVFLEMDAARIGVLNEQALLCWYHGHIGRELKRRANTKPQWPRSLQRWLCSSSHAILLE
jgi:hypothetical protein